MLVSTDTVAIAVAIRCSAAIFGECSLSRRVRSRPVTAVEVLPSLDDRGFTTNTALVLPQDNFPLVSGIAPFS